MPLMIVMIIAVGLILTSAVLRGVQTSRYNQVTTARALDSDTLASTTVKNALIAYVVVNQSLPCPAQYYGDKTMQDGHGGVMNGTAAATTSPSTGLCKTSNLFAPQRPGDSSTYDGVLPWVTLGLPRSAAMDAWGHFLSYRVAPDLTTPAIFINSSVYASHGFKVCAGLAPDGSCTTTIYDPGTSTGAAFVVISHGPNGADAIGPGGIRAPLSNSLWEQANALATPPAFISAPFNDTANPNGPDYFDDTVLAMSLKGLGTAANLYNRTSP
ncbi:MAG: hypothetical protein HQL37_09360 [Alphaproteobacteria bacterium]|nr:hypothetical protein [Alphaproteobacteria bacterium]